MNDSRILDIKHTPGDWHQYEIKLGFNHGWHYIIKSLTQVSQDLLQIDELITVDAKGQATNITEALRAANNDISQCKEVQVEKAALSAAGNSSSLRVPVKIIWFCQTQFLRVFTMMEVSDEDLRDFISKVLIVD